MERTHGGGLTQRGYQWNLNDHLGSSTLVLDGNRDTVKDASLANAPEERHSFDPWGARRNPANWAAANTPPVGSAPSDGQSSADATSAGTPVTVGRSSSQPSGYTGHQMLDDVGLIHMNGRLYDPFLGRFCAADPFVQSPNNIQNYNRYTYVLNNPLSLVDPSGHFFGIIFAIGAAIAGAVSAIVGAILSVLSAVLVAAAKVIAAAVKFTMAVLSKSAAWIKAAGSKLVTAVKAGKIGQAAQNLVGWWSKQSAITQGAITNASWNGIQTARNGGSFSDILRSVARGAVTGAVGAVTGDIIAGLQGHFFLHLAAHGISGGAMSVANGGSFKDGFVGGLVGLAVGAAFAGPSSRLGKLEGLTGVAARTTLAAVSGGVASKIMGGSFADGAYSAAFFHLFNNEAHRDIEYDGGFLDSGLDFGEYAGAIGGGLGQGSVAGLGAFGDGFLSVVPGTRVHFFADMGAYDFADGSTYNWSRWAGAGTSRMWALYGFARLAAPGTISIGFTRQLATGHAFWGVTRGGVTTWMETALGNTGTTQLTRLVTYRIRDTAVGWLKNAPGYVNRWNTLTGIPAFFPSAATALGVPASNCVCGALAAVRRAIFRF